MKKLQFTIAAFILLFTLQSSAQVSVNVNIGGRPDWCDHYEDDVEYFYLPEIEAYYDIRSAMFIYFGPGGWIRTAYLPEYCHGYDLHRGYKVAIDYHGHSPYAYHNRYKTRYYRDYHRNYRQEYYYPRAERRSNYIAMTNHRDYDNHNNYYKKEKHNNGRGNGNGRTNGRR